MPVEITESYLKLAVSVTCCEYLRADGCYLMKLNWSPKAIAVVPDLHVMTSHSWKQQRPGWLNKNIWAVGFPNPTARQHSMGGKDLLEFLQLPRKTLPQSAFPHLEIHLHYTQEPPDPIPLVLVPKDPCSFRNRNNHAIDAQNVEKEESGLSWAPWWECFLWWFMSFFDSLAWARVGDQAGSCWALQRVLTAEQGRLFPCPKNCGSLRARHRENLAEDERESSLRTSSDVTGERKGTCHKFKDFVFPFLIYVLCCFRGCCLLWVLFPYISETNGWVKRIFFSSCPW